MTPLLVSIIFNPRNESRLSFLKLFCRLVLSYGGCSGGAGLAEMHLVFDPALSSQQLLAAFEIDAPKLNIWLNTGELSPIHDVSGERRVYLSSLVRFVRDKGLEVPHPEVLGLLPHSPEEHHDEGLLLNRLLLKADWRRLTALLLRWYMEGRSLGDIFDGPIRAEFCRIGELWTCDPNGIGMEHRATSCCAIALSQLEALLKSPSESRPVALGGCLENDPHVIPSAMASAILVEHGFEALNFGPNTPAEVLLQAAAHHEASLVWVSVSDMLMAQTAIRDGLSGLARGLSERKVQLVVGGVRLEQDSSLIPDGAIFLPSMAALSAHLETMNQN
jgi:hypothetical protein